MRTSSCNGLQPAIKVTVHAISNVEIKGFLTHILLLTATGLLYVTLNSHQIILSYTAQTFS